MTQPTKAQRQAWIERWTGKETAEFIELVKEETLKLWKNKLGETNESK